MYQYVCSHCGLAFSSPQKNRVYCSKRCYGKATTGKPRRENRFVLNDDGSAFVILAGGEVAVVDQEDLDRVLAYRWCIDRTKRGEYASSKREGKHIRMHQIILPCGPHTHPDHKDGNGLNNRKSNLRESTRHQNGRNTRKAKHRGRSRYKGVALVKSGKWLSQIRDGGKNRRIGLFVDEVDAAMAYDDAAREVFGEYARLNFPREGEQGAL